MDKRVDFDAKLKEIGSLAGNDKTTELFVQEFEEVSDQIRVAAHAGKLDPTGYAILGIRLKSLLIAQATWLRMRMEQAAIIEGIDGLMGNAATCGQP